MQNKIVIIIMYLLLSKDTIGYITIKNKEYQIKNGIEDNVIDENVIGYEKTSSKMDSNKGTTILAGHNNTALKDLKTLNKGELIYIKHKNKTYTYKIYEKTIINKDYKFINTKDKTILIITCTKNKDKRLIIKAKIKPN